MGEISSNVLLSTSIFLIIPFICGYIAKKLKTSPLVGYIVGGLILGNLFGTIMDSETISNFAFFGILLLLFTVGLELNFSRLIQLKKYILIGGAAQILLSILFISLLGVIFKFSLLVSFLIGIALSSSSTSLIVKIIQEKGEEHSFIGEIALGILMFQDLAFIPFMIIFSSLTSSNVKFTEVIIDIIIGLFKSGIIIFVMYYFGKTLIPRLFDKVAKISRELLNLLIIIFIFGITYFSSAFDIPILVGIFIAGIIVAQASEHRHIFTQIRPFRDLLAVVFFIFIGSQIHLGEIVGMVPKIGLFTIAVVGIKAIILFFIFLLFKTHTRIAFAMSLYLFQIDEDAFILMSSAYQNGIISRTDYLFISASVLITLFITPFFITNKDNLYAKLRNWIRKAMPLVDNFVNKHIDSNISPIDEFSMNKHVVICGYGRVGSYIGRALSIANIPFIAIDYNFALVEKHKMKGINIIYGDPSDIDILDFAEVEKASLLISAVPGKYSQEAIIINAHKLNKDIRVITRIHNERDQKRVKDLGVEIVVQPEFEASLSIIRKILMSYGMEKEDIIGKIQRLKIEHGML